MIDRLDTTVTRMEEMSTISMLLSVGTIPLQLSSNGHLRNG